MKKGFIFSREPGELCSSLLRDPEIRLHKAPKKVIPRNGTRFRYSATRTWYRIVPQTEA